MRAHFGPEVWSSPSRANLWLRCSFEKWPRRATLESQTAIFGGNRNFISISLGQAKETGVLYVDIFEILATEHGLKENVPSEGTFTGKELIRNRATISFFQYYNLVITTV